MAQTTGGITFRGCKIEISTNGTNWTDISGWFNKIEVGGGERNIGEFFTADGDTPILGAGKRAALELTVAVVYTEGGGDPFSVLLTAFESAGPLYVRWSPKGGAAGQNMYTTSAGYVTTPVYPGGEVEPGDVIPVEFTHKVATITKSVV
jgi:hypothetical protein